MVSAELCDLFVSDTGERPGEVTLLPGAGSDRQYYRMKSMHYTRIGVKGTSVEENRAFVRMSHHFTGQGLPVPRVYAVSGDGLYYLQEDLGDRQLFDALAEGRRTGVWGEEEYGLLRRTIVLLPDLQFKGVEGFDFGCCYPCRVFDRRSVFWDLNYFKYCFLKGTKVDFDENLLEDDFHTLAGILLEEGPVGFMYRDFQTRNVMLREGAPYFIDFQGGRKGPFYYDVASFLWQARIGLPEELKMRLAEDYREALRKYVVTEKAAFYARLRHFVLFRLLQVLGAYGFRGYYERKPHFLESIPPAIHNLKVLLEEGFPEYPYLTALLERVAKAVTDRPQKKAGGLTVHVYSFSYKRGIPEDPSGNGGGFVFDCRAVHNPGRYESYRALTGMDEPVVRFLEEDGEMLHFLEPVYALVEASVSRYLERGFDSLGVAFGCTGGQHRSVYAAGQLAARLHEKFPVRVHLVHREQHIETYLEPKR